ncbi:MAG: hypothetical protein Kow0069_22410 [Promethearchaeota archaeon]
MTAELVCRCGIKRKVEHNYWVDENGNVVCAKREDGAPVKVVCKCRIEKEAGYVYFLDKNGDIARFRVRRG